MVVGENAHSKHVIVTNVSTQLMPFILNRDDRTTKSEAYIIIKRGTNSCTSKQIITQNAGSVIIKFLKLKNILKSVGAGSVVGEEGTEIGHSWGQDQLL